MNIRPTLDQLTIWQKTPVNTKQKGKAIISNTILVCDKNNNMFPFEQKWEQLWFRNNLSVY